MGPSAELLDNLRLKAAELALGLPSLRLVVLFGSVARQQARRDSDLDLGTEGVGTWDGLHVGSVLAALDHREPHVVDLERASDLLRFQVAREGVLLYTRAPDLWPRFQAAAALRYFDLAPMIAACTEGVRRGLLRQAGETQRG